jgi:hypothetical protein
MNARILVIDDIRCGQTGLVQLHTIKWPKYPLVIPACSPPKACWDKLWRESRGKAWMPAPPSLGQALRGHDGWISDTHLRGAVLRVQFIPVPNPAFSITCLQD